MKTIAVFFDDPAFDGPPFQDADRKQSYLDLASALWAKGGQMRIVRGMATYAAKTTFTGGWEFDGAQFNRTDSALTSDLVWNRGRFRGEADIPLINDPELERICNEKYATFELFREYCPDTAIARGASELNDLFLRHEGRMVVCKPLEGERGSGVFIGKPNQLPRARIELPCIVQEYIDTSGGIPGIVDGVHDFRILSLAGTIAACTVRTPPPGEYVASVALGGSMAVVPIGSIPLEAKAIFSDVDARLDRFAKRAYALDLGYARDGRWRIIELNAKPALLSPKAGEAYRPFLEAMAGFLMA